MEIKDIADGITKQNEAWDQYKKTNDEKIDKLASGKSVSDLDEKLSLINTEMNNLAKEMADFDKKSGRPNAENELTEDQQEHKKSFSRFVRKGQTDGLNELQLKAMNSGSDPDGGYTVLPEMDSQIDRIVGTISTLGRLASNKTISTNQYKKLVKTSGMAMRRVDDGSTGGETTEPKYDQIILDVFTAEVEPWVFNETLEDSSVNLESDLAEEAAIAFAEGLGSEYVSGDGVGKARGITSYTNIANASYTWGSVGYIASGAAGAFASSNPGDQVVQLQGALKSQYRPGAVFLTSDATLNTMRQFKDGSGAYYLWNPDASAGFGGRFLGSPVEIDDNMADVGAGSYSLAYGNFARGYTVVNRTGTTLIRDNITAKGKTKFNFRRRNGGGIHNYEAIKLMKFATS